MAGPMSINDRKYLQGPHEKENDEENKDERGTFDDGNERNGEGDDKKKAETCANGILENTDTFITHWKIDYDLQIEYDHLIIPIVVPGKRNEWYIQPTHTPKSEAYTYEKTQYEIIGMILEGIADF
ncbi:uncharacterized protein I303_103917 [Kwoniella dejecticola CBS 10117]|uniref:Uncharacterized protein n=1 Tax=Kwoniella dejecticola CBS 10117 TaxID=1296121 RepID=A0A1A6A837_9TREE|nr:uncharacterized protein I303_03935 [Kwoniella dejecticola CBS 10117]OBR86215.1 hypothetical protein I303_03935 [Kwoniella dejecticola CBS 10117]